jgi:hypothetical protein
VKILDFYIREDFGTEYCLALFKFKRRSLLQLSFSWNEYSSGPSLILYMGLNSIIDIMISCWKIGFCITIFNFNWVKDTFVTDFEFPN